MADLDAALAKAHNAEMARMGPVLAGMGDGPIPNFFRAFMSMQNGDIQGLDMNPVLKSWEDGEMAMANAISREFRKAPHVGTEFATPGALTKSYPALAKAAELDVGTLTNFANITGGQALGNVSLDTQLARGTVRPNSFTLYQALNKTPAKQIVDYWGYASELGGSAVGSAFASFSSVGSGALATSAGQYNLNFTTLKLLVDGRAITMALAAQNSYVNVSETETANAGMVILQTADWAIYWGNPTLYANQFQGISGLLPSQNVIDFQAYLTGATGSLTNEQYLFNLIYEQAASITTFRQFGRITHAFMTPSALGGLQSLTTTQLTNWLNGTIGNAQAPMFINGNLVGMNTRFGPIQFPLDLFITARDTPLNGVLLNDGTNYASTGINAPTSVTHTVQTAVAGSEFTSSYAGSYMYAVVACDSSMNESVCTYTSTAGTVDTVTVAANGSATLSITPNGSGQVAYRVFRSGKGYNVVGGSTDARQFRFIGEVASNGTTAVSFVDLNTKIPGGETIFLLDLDENDMALDWRYVLPLTKVDLFAQNLFMPWAVAMIGAPRIRVPKFHSQIKNYVPTNPLWNPLTAVNPVLPAGG